jgi:CRP-like cAMP-binding protein
MKKILVIEDNFDVRENLCEILDLANYETLQAENGKIGVKMVKEHKPDLIICDVMMPVLDGFGVLRILNRDPEYMHIPFMFLTAKAEKTDFRKGMGLGADDYITKPFDEVDLMDAIEMRLSKSAKLAAIDNSPEGVRSFFSEAKAEKALAELSADKENRFYAKKSSIYEENQFPKYLYYIISGAIKTMQTNEIGKELTLHLYGKGDFVGLISLIQDMPYNERAVCTEDTEVLLIPVEDFKLLMFNNRDFSAKFLKLLAHHASTTEEQLVDLAYSSVRKKVANAIIHFSNNMQNLNISVTREDLAGKAATSRESVIRTLSDFQREGLLEISGSQIKLLKKEQIANLPQ